MVQVDIITGFLGAGKTTLINKLLAEGLAAEKPVLIENEFGAVPIDHDLVPADVEVSLLASGCICCTMKGDFIQGITSVVEKYNPGRILIEPTGLAELDEVIAAVEEAGKTVPLELASVITVVSTRNFLPLMKVGGAFFRRQVAAARFALMSCTQLSTPEEIEAVTARFREFNPNCPMLAADWNTLDALEIMGAAQQALDAARGVCPACGEVHCGHGHDHDHEHDHDHGHHHHTPSAEDFTSIPCFPPRRYTPEALDRLLAAFREEKYGRIFRAKGFLKMEDGSFELVEYVYGHGSHRPCSHTGFIKFIVIGQALDEPAIQNLLMEV